MKSRKFAETSKTVVLLSVCAATVLCVNLAGSCSADDEDVYYGDELKTRAKATRSASEEQGSEIYLGSYVQSGHTLIFTRKTETNWEYHIALQWTSGYTGNLQGPYSSLSFINCILVGESSRKEYGYVQGEYKWFTKTFFAAGVRWDRNDKIKITLQYSANENGIGSPYVYDHFYFTLDDISFYVNYDSEIPDSTYVNN